jgi:colanic acid biosynthesis protein WcaH
VKLIKGWINESLFNKIRSVIPIATVDLLVIHDGKLLLMLRNNDPAKDLWFTPGGRIYLGERIEQTVERVLREETGFTPIKVERKGVMAHIWPNAESITVFYKVDVDGENVVMNDEHRAFKWVNEIDENLNVYVKEMIRESGLFQ